MTTAAERRRRPLAFALALLAVVLGVVALSRSAGAQNPNCGHGLFPPCSTTTLFPTTTLPRTTSTTDIFGETTTTFGDQTTLPRESTSTTSRRRTTTTDVVLTTSTTSVSVTTVKDLLVPGDGTKGAESTTTTVAPIATAGSGLSDNQLIALIVAGLAGVALVIGILTWRYWSATRSQEPGPPPRNGPRPDPGPGRSVFRE